MSACAKPSLLRTAARYLSLNLRRTPSQQQGHSFSKIVATAVFRKSTPGKLTVPFSFALLGFAASKQQQQQDKSKMADADIIKQADDLYKENKFQEVYDHLVKHKETESVEILWRLTRAGIDIGKLSSDKEFRKARIYEGMDIMERAMKLDSSNAYVHKWYAFAIKYTGEYEGTKKQIQNSYLIKEHLEKAGELNPRDPTTQYALGSWAFTFADMGWMTRKMAEAIFDKPPAASYDDALKYFEKAETMDPNFFSMNLLMIGKCYNALSNKEKAIEFLRRARDYSPKVTADDREANEEATALLSKLGVKN